MSGYVSEDLHSDTTTVKKGFASEIFIGLFWPTSPAKKVLFMSGHISEDLPSVLGGLPQPLCPVQQGKQLQEFGISAKYSNGYYLAIIKGFCANV
jgi:hypothetical protein